MICRDKSTVNTCILVKKLKLNEETCIAKYQLKIFKNIRRKNDKFRISDDALEIRFIA